jgi:Flp pilus assembly protein TadD
MSGTKAPNQGGAVRWAVLVAIVIPLGAIVIPLGGCTDANSNLTFAKETHELPARGDSGSALRMARATRSGGDLASSVLLYRNIVATGAATDEVKVELADTLAESGASDDAIDIYSQVGAKSSARLLALLGMTRASINLGEPAKALAYADAARSLGSQDARVLVDRGVALDSLNRHAEAQECYRAVLSSTPRHVSARNNLALSLALTGQFDEAVALMAPLVRSPSATPRVRENMALIYGLMGDVDHATKVSRIDLDESATRENLAFLAAVRETKP